MRERVAPGARDFLDRLARREELTTLEVLFDDTSRRNELVDEGLVLLLGEGGVKIVCRTALVITRLGEHDASVNRIGLDDGGCRVVERKTLRTELDGKLGGKCIGSERASRDDGRTFGNARALLVYELDVGRCVDETLHGSGEFVAIDCERTACSHTRVKGAGKEFGAEHGELVLERACRRLGVDALERVRADELGDVTRLVHGRGTLGAHLDKTYENPTRGELQRGLATGEPCPDDRDYGKLLSDHRSYILICESRTSNPANPNFSSLG